MATSSGTDKQLSGKNYVAQDEIWRSHVEHEQDASKRWVKVWSFLAVNEETTPQPRKPRATAPKPMQIQPPTPVEKFIKVEPSPIPFPSTTTKEIGWRASHDNLRLEKYGKYTRAKADILKTFNWPYEGSV